MSVELTQGAIEALANGSEVENVILQLLNMKQVSCSPRRFRLRMSDGQHFWSSFVLATQLNHLHDENLLVPNCVCKVKQTKCSTIPDGRIVASVLDVEIVQTAEETGGRIGNPMPYNKDDDTSSPQKSASTSTSVPAFPPSAAVPGPSKENNSRSLSSPRGSGKGFAGNSPMKASPSKFSPSKGNASPGPSPKVIPIAQLNPYQSRWTIKARVTNKSDIRTWSNSRGEGKLFSFEIVDESGEIRITAFNNEADKFFSLVEQGKVYYITKGTLKVANKQYSSLKNDYEMTLHAHSSVVPCDDAEGVPAVHFDFVPIAELERRDPDAIVDVIGVCESAEDVARVTMKTTSREISKRALNLIDSSGKGVTATLWGEKAETFDSSGQPVVAIKGARLSDFGGRSLSALFSSTIMVNPDIPEAFRLRSWYDQKGRTFNQSLTQSPSARIMAKMNWKSLRDIRDEQMGHGERADYFSCVATLLYCRKETCLYQACPSENCNKKVVDQQNGLYRCEKCDREFPNFKYRFMLSANLADYMENQWVTCFQDTAEVLLGHSAETLGQLRETDEAAFDEVFQKSNFTTYVFKNRVKLETFRDECRVKVTVMDVLPVDHREYCRVLLDNIRKLAQ